MSTIACRACGGDNEAGTGTCTFCGAALADRVALVLDEVEPIYYPIVIATISRLTGLDFVAAKSLVDGAPGATISKDLSPADAEKWKREREAIGAKCSLGDPAVN